MESVGALADPRRPMGDLGRRDGRWHRTPDSDFGSLVEIDHGRTDNIVQPLIVEGTPHLSELGIGLLVRLRSPVGLMCTAPPARGAMAKLSGSQIGRAHV